MRLSITIVLVLFLAGCANQTDRAKEVFAAQERAERFYQQGDYAKALIEYQQVVAGLPESAHAWLRTGNCHAQLGNYTPAVNAYRQALALDPEMSGAWINLSYVQAQILAQTVAQMYDNVPKTDPQIERVRHLVERVLAPFPEAREQAQPELSEGSLEKTGNHVNGND